MSAKIFVGVIPSAGSPGVPLMKLGEHAGAFLPSSAVHVENHSLPGLRWAVKRSFLSYLSRLPDGRMSVSDGAVLTDGDEVVWGAVTGDIPVVPDGVDQAFRFFGDLRYGGHGGLLFVRLADPIVTVRDGAGELSVVDTFSRTDGTRIPLVTFAISRRDEVSGHEVISADEVRLTGEGTEVFNMVYSPGEPFEPLTITWPVEQLDQPSSG